ncbi:hypothetical protein K2X83_01260 [Patescibacteria group bacterium]|nr:hypothetical protein [Patescibacteria group bacterium]
MSTKKLRRGGSDAELNEKRMNRLYEALLSLKTKEECAAFMRDICTVSELEALSERLAIAERVAKSESYLSIAGDLGASTTTVTRVAHWLNHGRGGYGTVISRLHKKAA